MIKEVSGYIHTLINAENFSGRIQKDLAAVVPSEEN